MPQHSVNQQIDHLFRHEAGKLTAVLTRIFGTHNLSMAEDVVQDTLVKAMEIWKFRGLPENPGAWLFTVARNQAVDLLRKEKRRKDFNTRFHSDSQKDETNYGEDTNIDHERQQPDDMLRMMFVCCHPSIALESQVALILKTLCGFSVNEIAKAFVCKYDTIEKRLTRARVQLREQNIAFELPQNNDIEDRLENVLMSVYLLFNEGYNSTEHQELIRKDLLEEALRLCQLLLEHPATRHPKTYALLALIHFSMCRIPARLDNDGSIVLLKNQDRKLWNGKEISKGLRNLNLSASGDKLSTFHLEAAIACEHCLAPRYEDTDWPAVKKYYDLLYKLRPSPIVALNRAIVTSEIDGPAAGIEAIRDIPCLDTLEKYYLLPATLGELHFRLNEPAAAARFLREAIGLTQSASEIRLLTHKIKALGNTG